MAEKPAEVHKIEVTRYESLPMPAKAICLVLFAFGTRLFVFHVFGWSIGGCVIETVRYYYFLIVTLIAERTVEREPLVT